MPLTAAAVMLRTSLKSGGKAMAEKGETSRDRRGAPWRMIGWGGVAFVLLLPLVFRAPWTLSDFIVAAAMLGAAGLALELGVRMSPDPFYRVGAAVAVAAALLLVWVNLAVGILGGEGNPANLMFLGVIAIAVVGTIAARFRAAGASKAMFAAAAAQVLAGAVGFGAGWGSAGSRGLYEAILGTTLFTPLWIVSGVLFRKAASHRAPEGL